MQLCKGLPSNDFMQALFDQGRLAPCPSPFNLAAYVLQHADDLPDKIALAVLGQSGSERWSYAKLKSAVLGVGSGLLAEGLNPGDRVLLRLGNSVDYPLAYLGAIAAGIVPVPTSSQLTEPEVRKIADIAAKSGYRWNRHCLSARPWLSDYFRHPISWLS